MKNVYYITNMFPSKKDNYGIFCKKVFDFFSSSNFFSIKKMSAIYGKSNLKIYNIFRYFFLLLSISYNLIFNIKKFDLIYIQYVWKHAFFVSIFSRYIMRKNKTVVINFHGEDLTNYQELSNFEKKSFIKICFLAKLIVVPSEYFKNLLLSTLPIETKIFVSASGGVDSKNFYKEKNYSKEKNIVYCSRFDLDKGWDDFINVINSLHSEGYDIKAKMIGYGKQTDEVHRLIKEYQLEQVIAVFENISQENIAEIYSNSYIFIFPTRRLAESLGLVALEAMSCGLPVIASKIGAISEYVLENDNGFLYSPGNTDELCDILKQVLTLSDDEYNKLSNSAIETSLKYKDFVVANEFINKIISLF